MKHPLPDSANDLLIKDGKLLMRSLSVYEVLRRFSHILRLAPFKFEDFSAALLAGEQSSLLAEIHIQLLKTLLREDRQQQTWLGPPDIRDSINLYLFSTDHTNWPATLRIYLSADIKENSPILEKLDGAKGGFKNYPFNVNIQIKLDVLEQLCDQFLLSNLAREDIVNGDENNTNNIIGAPEGGDINEKNGNLRRHEDLGSDKLGRRYWLLVRRLFVVDELEEDVRYYTTLKQFAEILDSLNQNRNDKNLIDNLQEQRCEIERQMKITEEFYQTTLKDFKKEDGSYSQLLGQDGAYRNYTNPFPSNSQSTGKNHQSDEGVTRSLNNKFCMNSMNAFKWCGAINGQLTSLTVTIRSTVLKFETMIPITFLHPCWQSEKSTWIRSINYAQKPEDFAVALSLLEASIRPVLFKSAWYDALGFCQLFRSTFAEREELKKTDRQPRGFERREWFSQDFELSYRLGTMVKFSARLKPVKHQVWKQKGEEYRLTGLNAWFWRSRTFKSRLGVKPKRTSPTVDTVVSAIGKKDPQQIQNKKCLLAQPKIPPCHNFLTKHSKIRSILVLPDAELRKLARSGGLREAKSFSYTAKQNNYVWPYGMTPRPTFRTCWLYRNRLINTMQDVALQLKVIYACLRWDDMQVKPPASGHNVISTDEATVSIELLKKRDKLPYLTHSEYLIKKTVTPIEQPTKYRKVGPKKVTPSARSGLRARRQTVEEEEKGPTIEEVWVSEDQLELWELRQFDEKIQRQNRLLRERALREEAERRRKIEEEKRRKAEQERRRRVEEEAKKARLNQSTIGSSAASPITKPGINTTQTRSLPTTPVLTYFRTEQGQIIRLPASYLERGTPLILRHVGPGPTTNTYIIRPQVATPVAGRVAVSTTPATPPTTTTTTATSSTPAAPTTAAAQVAPATPSIAPVELVDSKPAATTTPLEPPATPATAVEPSRVASVKSEDSASLAPSADPKPPAIPAASVGPTPLAPPVEPAEVAQPADAAPLVPPTPLESAAPPAGPKSPAPLATAADPAQLAPVKSEEPAPQAEPCAAQPELVGTQSIPTAD